MQAGEVMKSLKQNIFIAESTVLQTDISTGREQIKTCNSYVISGEKTALIGGAADSVPDDIIKNAAYAVFNHAFPALGIKRILEINPKIQIMGTIAAIKNLKEITNSIFNERIAKDGAELDLGGRTLRFMITPNLNWPDTMMTYCSNDNVLFSGQAFGSYRGGHLREFYDNELARFKPFVLTALEQLKNLDIDIICPETGAVLTDSAEAISKYELWSKPSVSAQKTASIFYASQNGSTASMAEIVKSVMTKNGVSVKCFNAAVCGTEEMLDAFYGADMLVFGSSTIHRNAAKPIWDIISAADLVNMKQKPCMVFGSYGWGGEGIWLLHNHLKLLRMRPFDKPFGCRFTPSEDDVTELEKYTERFLETNEF